MPQPEFIQLNDDMVVIRTICAVSAALSTIGDKDSSSTTIIKRAEKMEDYILHGSAKHKNKSVDD